MKPRALVLDLFGDYLRYADAEIKLADLTTLLGDFGVEGPTVRVNMSRLRKEGWFTSRRLKRETIYKLSDHILKVLDEGRQRIFERLPGDWDGQWTMVTYHVPESERAVREQLRKDLAWHGFGPLSSSLWLTPHNRFPEMKALVQQYPTARIDVLWCGAGDVAVDRELASRCWTLDRLAADYQQFIDRYAPVDHAAGAAPLPGRDALVERTRLISDFRRFPFRDPQLPSALRPDGWPGDDAFLLFRRVHSRLGPSANAYVSDVIGRPLVLPAELQNV